MYPLSDNDMDRISREASEQFDVEPSTSGWDRLEKRLDKELPKEKDRKRFLWIFLLFLLIGGGLLSLQLIRSNPTESSPVAHTVPAPPALTVAPEAEGKDPEAANAPAPSSTPAITTEATRKKAQVRETLSAPAPVTQNKVVSTYRSQSKSGNKKKTLPSTEKTTLASRKELAPNTTATGTDVSATETADNLKEEQNSSSKETIEKPITATPVAALPATDSTKQTPAPELSPVPAATAKKKNNNSSKNRLALGLTAGIDWSRIHSMADERNGYNVGITVSYDISPRWSVTTGAIITRKKYTALGKDFNPPDHYWTTYVKLQTLEGYCQMIDIPLNLRYNITNRKQSKLFATTGLSSYLMSRQYYKYYYINSANQAMERDWTSTKDAAYWMGILNLSAGYEKQLSSDWSLQAEPFLKLPLKGVGFGKMDISSYGALFTLKYRPKF